MILPNDPEVLAHARRDEGLRLEPYRCPAGRLTIGYGTVIEHIDEAEAEWLLGHRLALVHHGLSRTYEWFAHLSDNRQRALVLMAYQLGLAGLGQFGRMLTAIGFGDYSRAADEMLDSVWHVQTPRRAQLCSELMRAG